MRLSNECSKKGKGLSKIYLDGLRKFVLEYPIDEVKNKTGYSYFPKGIKRGRVLKVCTIRKGLYLEFNSVQFEKNHDDIWKLTDDERKEFHADGVTCCYVGEDFETAKLLIKEAVLVHPLLKILNTE